MKRKIVLLVSILSLSLVLLLPVKAAQLDLVGSGTELLEHDKSFQIDEMDFHVTPQTPYSIDFVDYEYSEDGEAVFADENADEASEESSSWVNLAIVILVPLLVAGVVCGIFLSQMKTAVPQRAADNFIPGGGVKLTMQTDKFLFKTETRTRIEKQPSSGDSSDSN